MIAIGIHGGCGTLPEESMTPAQWDEARTHLADALRAGWALLARGGSALDAVEAAVAVLEDSPWFNAGFSAAMNEDGEHELDAAIMDGEGLRAGAVCAARRIRNPVRAARAVLEQGACVLLAGPAADAFAQARGLEMVEPGWFTTERQTRALASLKARATRGTLALAGEAEKHGTVGAVALDQAGGLAAATSTGGYHNKPAGRVGDSPIVGAGTYARNGVCAVSGTGQGELFMRLVASHDVAARMLYARESLDEASGAVLRGLSGHGVGAGMIAIDADGRIVAPFNTLGMYRGWVGADGALVVASHRRQFELGRMGG